MRRIRRYMWAAIAVSGALVAAGAPAGATVATPAAKLASPPTVTSVRASRGYTPGGQTVTVRGTGFTQVKKVKFGNTKGTALKVLSPERLTVVDPYHPPGTVDVVVITGHGQSKTVHADRFTYMFPPPSVTGLSAGSTTQAGLTTKGSPTLVVAGVGFTKESTVRFGSTTAAVVDFVDSSAIEVTVPPHAPGTVNVQVSNAKGTSKPTPADRFSYERPSAPTLKWGAPALIDRTQGDITSISCPTPSFCAAIDGDGYSLTEQAGRWSAPVPVADLARNSTLTCTSRTFCAATTASGVITYNGTTWSRPMVGSPTALEGLSCASSTFCGAVDDQGNAYIWNGITWAHTGPMAYPPPETGGLQFTSISCPTEGWCMAVTLDGYAVQYDGTWGAPVPADIFLPGNDEGGTVSVVGVSCTSSEFCALVDGGGAAVTFDGSTWAKPTAVTPNPQEIENVFLALSCAAVAPGPPSCLAVTDNKRVFAYNGSDWKKQAAPAAGVQLSFVSCSRPASCVGVQGGTFAPAASLVESLEWNGTRWRTPTTMEAPQQDPRNLSCVKGTSFCAALDLDGNAVTTEGHSWSKPERVDPNGSPSVSCATRRFCAAVDLTGDVTTYNDGTWTTPRPVGSAAAQLSAVSCPSAVFCLAADLRGNVITFDGKTWSKPKHIDSYGEGTDAVACASSTTCVVLDNIGRVVTLTGSTWSKPAFIPPLIGPYFMPTAVSCPTTTFCAFAGDDRIVTYNDRKWSRPTIVDAAESPLTAISCARATACVAVDNDPGFLQHGSAVYTYNGKAWSRATNVAQSIGGLACPMTTSCTATTDEGYALRATTADPG